MNPVEGPVKEVKEVKGKEKKAKTKDADEVTKGVGKISISKKGAPLKKKDKKEKKAKRDKVLGVAVKKAARAGPANGQEKQRKKRRRKHVVREIKKLQNSTAPVLPKSTVRRLIREIAQEHVVDIRFYDTALYALQEGLEAFMHDFFTTARLLAKHRKGVTIKEIDIAMVKDMLNFPLVMGASNRDNF